MFDTSARNRRGWIIVVLLAFVGIGIITIAARATAPLADPAEGRRGVSGGRAPAG